jgi:hypothetical protein
MNPVNGVTRVVPRTIGPMTPVPPLLRSAIAPVRASSVAMPPSSGTPPQATCSDDSSLVTPRVTAPRPAG